MQPSSPGQRSLLIDSSSGLLNLVEAQMLASVRPAALHMSARSANGADAAAYHLGAGGQRVRAKIALHAGLAVGLSQADAIVIAATVELLHNASLVHDDIQDRDTMRRGQLAVWARFDVNTAICTGDLLLSAAYATLCKLSNSAALADLISLVHSRISTAIDGQCADLAESNQTTDETLCLVRYQKIAIAKSGALLSLPIELALLAAGYQDYSAAACRAAEAFAVGYQIADDLHDVQRDMFSAASHKACNIISIFGTTGAIDESVEKAKQLGLEKIDFSSAMARRLPFNMGEQLENYAHQLRDVLVRYKFEALTGGN